MKKWLLVTAMLLSLPAAADDAAEERIAALEAEVETLRETLVYVLDTLEAIQVEAIARDRDLERLVALGQLQLQLQMKVQSETVEPPSSESSGGTP